MQQTQVILKPQDPQMYGTNEPQYITAIEPSESWVWIAATDCRGSDKTNTTFYSSQPLGINVRRITVKGFTINWDSPNVNPRNNRIQFFSTTSGIHHSVHVPIGYYATSVDLTAAIVVAMNIATFSSGLTFSAVPNALEPDAYTLSCIGGSFYFDAYCEAVAKGKQLWNLPGDLIPATSKRIGTMFRMYTQFIDIISHAITKNGKMRSITSNYTSQVAIRAYVGGAQAPGEVSFYVPPVDLHFAHRVEEPIYNIDITMLDQNGDPLYVSDIGALQWQITLGFEG